MGHYGKVLALADVRGWEVDLEREGGAWRLKVYEGDDLIASAKSALNGPHAFEVLADKVLSDLKGGARL